MVYVVQYHFICWLIVWCAVLFPMMAYGSNYRVCFSRIIKKFFSNWKKNFLFHRFNRFMKSNHESRLLRNQLWQDLSPKINYIWQKETTSVAICKPRHWNLGIRLGIRTGTGTDTTNFIIYSSIKTMDTKPSRVVF